MFMKVDELACEAAKDSMPASMDVSSDFGDTLRLVTIHGDVNRCTL